MAETGRPEKGIGRRRSEVVDAAKGGTWDVRRGGEGIWTTCRGGSGRVLGVGPRREGEV